MPAAPSSLAVTRGDQSARLSWTAVSGATSYNLYQGTASGSEAPALVQSGLTTTSAVVAGLTNGTAYYFIVRAVNAVGGSAASNEASVTPATTMALSITSLELAQTHVLPEAGKSWSPSGSFKATENLHLVSGRDALALVRLAASDAQNPVLEALDAGGRSVGTVALTTPAGLPATEDNGAVYGSDLYSAKLSGSWLAVGVQLRAKADNYTAGAAHAANVGADMPMTLRVLPFYLFGATDANSGQSLAATGTPPSDAIGEIFAKWPLAMLDIGNHPAQRVSWPRLVIGPRADASGTMQPAYVMSSLDDRKDGFAPLSATLTALSGFRNANGEGPLAAQYYGPLVMLKKDGTYGSPGGGLGSVGGDTGVGDTSYAGIFIHEQGHAFGLSHAGEAFDTGNYPYEWGSINGSLWGYDPNKKQFLAPFVPTSASTYKGCASDTFAGHARAIDSDGRCVKQDPMQSGSGDQASGYRFTAFSDFSTAVMQRHLEGTTIVASDGTHSYSGGRWVRDGSFAGGYKRWDAIDRKWINVTPTTASSALYGLNQGAPTQTGVAVYTLHVAYDNACGKNGTVTGCATSVIYPPVKYVGNLVPMIDPTDASQLAKIDPNGSGAWKWFCDDYGCDYSLRLSYTDGTIRYVLLNDGFRNWFHPSDVPDASATDPLDSSSFATWTVNAPADATLNKAELIYTPMAWQGLPPSQTVLTSWQ